MHIGKMLKNLVLNRQLAGPTFLKGFSFHAHLMTETDLRPFISLRRVVHLDCYGCKIQQHQGALELSILPFCLGSQLFHLEILGAKLGSNM